VWQLHDGAGRPVQPRQVGDDHAASPRAALATRPYKDPSSGHHTIMPSIRRSYGLGRPVKPAAAFGGSLTRAVKIGNDNLSSLVFSHCPQ
jgi:hypothetical protein